MVVRRAPRPKEVSAGMAQDGIRPQIILSLPARAGEGLTLARSVAAAAKVAPIATVVIEPDSELPILPPELLPAVEQIQALGIATLIARDASLARSSKPTASISPLRKRPLPATGKPARSWAAATSSASTVGRTRHDAMTLGDEGADYIAFGIPAHVEDRDTRARPPPRAHRMVVGNLRGALRRFRC